MNDDRRTALRRIGMVVGVGALAAPAVVSSVHPAALACERFGSTGAAFETLAQLKTAAPHMTGAWDLPHVLHHVAQSIEYSISGFPAPKPAWFRATLGSYAFALFNTSGRMTHSLSEPIPGAADIAQGQPLAPHFAYGTLDKATYARAHLMHLANHWNEAVAA